MCSSFGLLQVHLASVGPTIHCCMVSPALYAEAYLRLHNTSNSLFRHRPPLLEAQLLQPPHHLGLHRLPPCYRGRLIHVGGWMCPPHHPVTEDTTLCSHKPPNQSPPPQPCIRTVPMHCSSPTRTKCR